MAIYNQKYIATYRHARVGTDSENVQNKGCFTGVEAFTSQAGFFGKQFEQIMHRITLHQVTNPPVEKTCKPNCTIILLYYLNVYIRDVRSWPATCQLML